MKSTAENKMSVVYSESQWEVLFQFKGKGGNKYTC